MSIGAVMEARRVELGWTQVELGQRAGVDARQIRRYESGEGQPTIAVAQAIARALGITLDELVGEAPGWNGVWWSVWEGLGPEPVRGRLDLAQRGNTVVIRPPDVRDPSLSDDGLRCEGNLLAEPDSLVGWFELRLADVSVRGTLQLRRRG
jgi:transcriptional regulator with XRE-family HTH domain